MQSYHLEQRGSVAGLVLRADAPRSVAPHQVRVRMRAASLNYRDLLIMQGSPYGGHVVPDVVPLSDGAGEVTEIGAAVHDVAVGQRVLAVFNAAWLDGPPAAGYFSGALGGSRDGTLAQEMILGAEGVLPVPEHLSFEEAAAHGCASTTAWSSLVGGRPLTAGQTLLVQGTGGVSMFALQYGKAAGARVIAITSSAAKADRLRSLGADDAVNYLDDPDWQIAVRRLTDGNGVDRVVEIGGPGTIQRSIAATAIGGHIAIVGFSAGTEGSFSPVALLGNGISLEGIAVGSRRNAADSLRLTHAARLRPVLDQQFAFDKASDAYQHMLDRKHLGKVIIRID